MQYYIFPDKIQALLDERACSLDELLQQLDGDPKYLRDLLEHGGPTRSLTLLRGINEFLGCLHSRYTYLLYEDGDFTFPPPDHRNEPLCYDVSKFQRFSWKHL